MFKDPLFKFSAEEVKVKPHNLIGALTFKTNRGQPGKGTGTLLSQNLVLTAAHNVIERGEIFSNFKFYPGQDGLLEKCYEVVDLFFPEEYTSKPNVTNDYALLKLSERVKTIKDFVPLCGDLDIDNTTNLFICGYPASGYKNRSFRN